MNEFLEQFVIEARELVEQATADLLALESEPGARERLDGAFRAFHTLKGSAGIVDFEAMGRVMHAAEDLLARLRAGGASVTPEVVGKCFGALDQVAQWLDEVEETGSVPVQADEAAARLSARFTPAAAAAAEPARADWVQPLLARHPEAAGRARAALRYAPDREAFFRGEDPIAELARLHDLLVLEAAPSGDWPPLQDLDPFACQLTFLALLGSSDHDGARPIGADVIQLEAKPTTAGFGALTGAARDLIDEQVLVLSTGEAHEARLGCVARAAANVLTSLGRADGARAIQRALDESLAVGNAAPLTQVLQTLLEGSSPDTLETTAGPTVPEPAARAIRVEVDRIDALADLTGELVVAKNAIGHLARLAENGADGRALAPALRAHHEQVDRLVRRLQQAVLAIRVLPFRHVFRRFPRLVREMAASLGKTVRLEIEGEDTEADKAVVEALFEPLLHVLRNAVDHGVETPQARAALGKPDVATIRLTASRSGDQVSVEVQDDGRGVDVARVRQLAAERGLASPEALAEMSDEAATELIFAPGFSTAASVSGLSGRGVGMDAVRTVVERFGGAVAVDSAEGQGARVSLTLPFSVMVTQVMTLESGGQLFAVPMECVLETLRIPREQISGIGAARAFSLRERTVPLLDLRAAIGAALPLQAGTEARILVASVGGELVGLEVERLGERMDVMLKPVEGLLASVRGVAGTTLLGDGRVLLILDVQDLLH